MTSYYFQPLRVGTYFGIFGITFLLVKILALIWILYKKAWQTVVTTHYIFSPNEVSLILIPHSKPDITTNIIICSEFYFLVLMIIIQKRTTLMPLKFLVSQVKMITSDQRTLVRLFQPQCWCFLLAPFANISIQIHIGKGKSRNCSYFLSIAVRL